MGATLTFLGGAGTVTGSKTLVEGGGRRLLLDAGLFQGMRELRRRNWAQVPFDPAGLDAVVLTHAHLDHCGYLPALAREGLDAPVLCTRSTAALAALVLRDSARLQEEDAAFAAGRGFSKHTPPRPLYDTADVERVLPMLEPIELDERVEVEPGLAVTLSRAGHILGSTSALIEIDDVRIVGSGDLGRPTHPLLLPPAPPAAADVLLVESTYGDRLHDDAPDEVLAEVLRRTLGGGGVVLIPAFAVDRTEVLLMALARLVRQGRVPPVPVHVDSPMALKALDIYRAAIATRAPDVRPEVADGPDPFDPGDLREARTAEQSARLNDPDHPCIVVSASGMATGGRVVHHLRHLLPQRRHAVVLVGFQAPGTRGRDLADGARTLRMHGVDVPVRAKIVTVEGLSQHADADELVAWVASAPTPARRVEVVHGEPEASAALAARLHEELGLDAHVAVDGGTLAVPAPGPA